MNFQTWCHQNLNILNIIDTTFIVSGKRRKTLPRQTEGLHALQKNILRWHNVLHERWNLPITTTTPLLGWNRIKKCQLWHVYKTWKYHFRAHSANMIKFFQCVLACLLFWTLTLNFETNHETMIEDDASLL